MKCCQQGKSLIELRSMSDSAIMHSPRNLSPGLLIHAWRRITSRTDALSEADDRHRRWRQKATRTNLEIIDHPGVVVARHRRSKHRIMTIGGRDHKLEFFGRGALQNN